MKTERQIIEECKKLLEQNEPFQRKMKAKHSRMKKRVIGHGGQSNTPPYSEKPSMKRSKSAPPIGENVYDIDESLGKTLAGIGAAATLAYGGIKAGAAAQDNTQQNKPEVTQQYQQNDINQEFEKNEKKYNIFSEYNLEDPRNMKQFKQNFFNAFGYKDDAEGNEIFDLFVKEIHYGTMEASAVLSILSTTAGVHKTADPTKTDKEIFSIAYVDLVQNQAIGAYKLAQENNITNAASKLKNYRKRFEY